MVKTHQNLVSSLELKKKLHKLRVGGIPRVKRLSLDVIIKQTEGKQGEWHVTSRWFNQEDRRESICIDLINAVLNNALYIPRRFNFFLTLINMKRTCLLMSFR